MFLQRQLKAEYPSVTPRILTGLQTDDTERAVDVLARTLWGEARGESLHGIEAVASVIVNRVTHASRMRGFWWGDDIISVCRKPYQFSCWNKSDPNFFNLQQVTGDDRAFALCQRIARRAVKGVLPDSTSGATHYHADTIHPNWANNATPTVTIGHHIFYRITG